MDGIFGIGPLELFFVAIIALIVLGPERLPGVLREIAKTIRRVREITNEFTNQFSDEIKALDEINPRKILNDMVDPSKPLPGEKSSELADGKSTANKPVATPKPSAPKSESTKEKATANAILSSKAATEAARATKAAKEAEAAKEAAKALDAKTVPVDGVNGTADGAADGAGGEVENSIMPPSIESAHTPAPSTTPIDTSVTSASTTNASTTDAAPAETRATETHSTDAHSTDAHSTEPAPMDERA